MFSFVNHRRWSNVNHHWGIFTYSPSGKRTDKKLGIQLRSADEQTKRGEYDYDGCHLLLRYNRHCVIVELPAIISPKQTKIYPKSWSAETIERMGRNWYIDYTAKEYGFFTDWSNLHIYYGEQTDSSNGTKSKCFFLPWTITRVVRESFYNIDGSLASELNDKQPHTGQKRFELYKEVKSKAEKFFFKVKDSDDTVVWVESHISETECRYGTGWFKWVSWFKKPIVRRSLSLSFSTEVGSEKGSWKGGLMGTSIQTYAGEHPEITFTRFIEESKSKDYRSRLNLTYLGMYKEMEDVSSST